MQTKHGVGLLFRACIVAALLAICANGALAKPGGPRFRVIALAEKNSIHKPFVDAAKAWLEKEAIANSFSIEYIENTEQIDDAFLSHYQLFLQLDYPPYMWAAKAMKAFQNY